MDGRGEAVDLFPDDCAGRFGASGRTPSRRITRAETRPASPREAETLQLATGAPVDIVEGVSLADGQPLAAFRSVFPGDLADYTRAETRMTAKLAPPVLALALQIQPGAPVQRSVAENVDGSGVPVEPGPTWFAGDRVTLTVNPDQA